MTSSDIFLLSIHNILEICRNTPCGSGHGRSIELTGIDSRISRKPERQLLPCLIEQVLSARDIAHRTKLKTACWQSMQRASFKPRKLKIPQLFLRHTNGLRFAAYSCGLLVRFAAYGARTLGGAFHIWSRQGLGKITRSTIVQIKATNSEPCG